MANTKYTGAELLDAFNSIAGDAGAGVTISELEGQIDERIDNDKRHGVKPTSRKKYAERIARIYVRKARHRKKIEIRNSKQKTVTVKNKDGSTSTKTVTARTKKRNISQFYDEYLKKYEANKKKVEKYGGEVQDEPMSFETFEDDVAGFRRAAEVNGEEFDIKKYIRQAAHEDTFKYSEKYAKATREAIQRVKDEYGLTFNMDNYTVGYLMANGIEGTAYAEWLKEYHKKLKGLGLSNDEIELNISHYIYGSD